MIVAPSYSGKSTAHHDGIGLDPEESVAYQERKEKAGGGRNTKSKEWQRIKDEVYSTQVEELMVSESELPLILHPNKALWDRADKGEIETRLVAIPKAELEKRMKDWETKQGSTGQLKVASRHGAAARGLADIIHRHLQTGEPIYSSIEEAANGQG